jgi:hypothetical protein
VTESIGKIFSLPGYTVHKLDLAVCEFLTDIDAIGNSDKFRILELHARAFIAIVQQYVDTGVVQLSGNVFPA